jgi:hypothetical protein
VDLVAAVSRRLCSHLLLVTPSSGGVRNFFLLPFNFPRKIVVYALTGISTYFSAWEVKVGSLDVLPPYFRFIK